MEHSFTEWNFVGPWKHLQKATCNPENIWVSRRCRAHLFFHWLYALSNERGFHWSKQDFRISSSVNHIDIQKLNHRKFNFSNMLFPLPRGKCVTSSSGKYLKNSKTRRDSYLDLFGFTFVTIVSWPSPFKTIRRSAVMNRLGRSFESSPYTHFPSNTTTDSFSSRCPPPPPPPAWHKFWLICGKLA
jgi:hypothetical protein